MAVTQAASLNAVTIGTTEYGIINAGTGLGTSNTAGIYQLILDANNMASGDVFRVRYYEKCLSGGTQRCIFEAFLYDAQTEMFVGPAVMLLHGWEMSLTKIAGTDRAMTASIRAA